MIQQEKIEECKKMISTIDKKKVELLAIIKETEKRTLLNKNIIKKGKTEDHQKEKGGNLDKTTVSNKKESLEIKMTKEKTKKIDKNETKLKLLLAEINHLSLVIDQNRLKISDLKKKADFLRKENEHHLEVLTDTGIETTIEDNFSIQKIKKIEAKKELKFWRDVIILGALVFFLILIWFLFNFFDKKERSGWILPQIFLIFSIGYWLFFSWHHYSKLKLINKENVFKSTITFHNKSADFSSGQENLKIPKK